MQNTSIPVWKLVAVLVFVAGAAGSASAASTPSAATPATAPPSVTWNTAILRKDDAWYGTPEARAVAANLLRYQSTEGGWPKNTDLAQWPPKEKDAAFATDGRANTFDNNATTTPLDFLARVITATRDRTLRAAFDRGLAYTLAAQYENGGWPQFYPLREGYYSHVTFNDDAMTRILTLLRDVAAGRAPYAFVDKQTRRRAAGAVQRGLEVILRTQIRQGDALTVWCAQYDEHTLAPAWARAYEPPSLSGNESVGILRFLMGLEQPSPQVIAAVEGGVRWFKAAAVRDVRLETFVADDGKPDKRALASAGAEPLWARFYALGTNAPVFMGRDSTPHPSFNDIERERRNGYGYYGTWPRQLLDAEYPAWKARAGG